MPHAIHTVAVIGAGTMGAAIAGLLANAGLAVHLLDVTPTSLTSQEEAAGLTLQSPKVRNRIVRTGFERIRAARPANLFSESAAARICLGNLDEDFDRAVGEADWVLEAIVERLEPKQVLMARIEEAASPHAVISTNTSGIPIRHIAQGRSADFQRRFLGTHFFNPPRYLHLVELISTEQTDAAVINGMTAFLENVLGKGVVRCKDTPNFIANRMLAFVQSDLLDYAVRHGCSVESVDALTGPLLGRPRTATFRLNDVVGIDIMAFVIQSLYPRIPHDEARERLHSPGVTSVLHTLLDAGHLGAKSGQGFYRTVVDESGAKSFWGLDLQAASQGRIDYAPPQQPRWDSVTAARRLPLAERLRALVAGEDEASRLIWHTLAHTLAYASQRIPEIADSFTHIDSAMQWGFGWELGPFEIWDALGVGPTLERMTGEGIVAAPWVQDMVDADVESFYAARDRQRTAYSPADRRRHALQLDERIVHIDALRHAGGAVAENDSASLFDMGDGVLLAEFHGKMNTFDEHVFRILRKAIERLHGDATGLVIGNQGPTFSAGLNLAAVMEWAQSGRFDAVERLVREGQDVFLALREAPAPVVAAPFQRALGGGLEIALAADRIVAHAESYVGLVEVGVGLVPGWGGCKEMVRRHVSPHMRAEDVDPAPHLRQVFETIGFAKASSSAQEAIDLGYFSRHDRIVMNVNHLLWEAKYEALVLAEEGYRPPDTQRNVYAAGRDALAALLVQAHMLHRSGHISAYDAEIAGRLAHVLCGGELSEPAWMDEQYFLDLERDALLSLAGQEKTRERIVYMLKNGKPLRN